MKLKLNTEISIEPGAYIRTILVYCTALITYQALVIGIDTLLSVYVFHDYYTQPLRTLTYRISEMGAWFFMVIVGILYARILIKKQKLNIENMQFKNQIINIIILLVILYLLNSANWIDPFSPLYRPWLHPVKYVIGYCILSVFDAGDDCLINVACMGISYIITIQLWKRRNRNFQELSDISN